MDNSQIYDKLTTIFHDVFGDDSIVLRPDLAADQVDDWDSLSHVRMVLTVEKTFRIKFSAAEISKLKNVGELTDLISAKAA